MPGVSTQKIGAASRNREVSEKPTHHAELDGRAGVSATKQALASILLVQDAQRRTGSVRGPREKNPIMPVTTTRAGERLPPGTAILSNIALSLLMWNIALRLIDLLLKTRW